MLCPEVWNFPPPKTMISLKKDLNLESTLAQVKNVNFYKSLIVTCPDDLAIPGPVEEALFVDTDYYKISNCSLTEFLEPIFIEKFVKNGNLYCLSADRNCLVDNCIAVTPNGILTLHIPEFVYQTLGLEGHKSWKNFYEASIDLKNVRQLDRVKYALEQIDNLGLMDFYVLWEPEPENICPSSIAKYFNDRNINVSLGVLEAKRLTPTITEIPSLKDISPEEMVEWMGLLVHNVDLTETENYISTYCEPKSEFALESSRICILIVKGVMTPTTVSKVCKHMQEYVDSRELDNYWASLSAQSCEDSMVKWSSSSPNMFQPHNLSCNIFFEHSGQTIYSVGQIKYT